MLHNATLEYLHIRLLCVSKNFLVTYLLSWIATVLSMCEWCFWHAASWHGSDNTNV